MNPIESYGLAVLLASVVVLVGVLSNRLSQRLRVPAPGLFLVAAAMASDIWPGLYRLPVVAVEQVVTIGLAVILFDGGMHIGWHRFRAAAAATAWLGVVGTLVTTAATAFAAHALFGFGWPAALLLGTALAPTDPAVVFSVLGRREVTGRTGALLQGESGANDPVGIALLLSLLGASGSVAGQVGHVVVEFGLQMVVGGAVGVAGGFALLATMRRIPLPSEGLYAVRVLASALALYGLATVAHGSGFLAVFVAGIVIGDERAPYKREIERFHSSFASLAEVVSFVLLGVTIPLREVWSGDTLRIGLGLAVLLSFVIRPVLVGLMLWPVRLAGGERLFVLWTGLKGAVPILLGAFILQAGVPGAGRIYDVIFVVVAFSVFVQGGLVPTLARRWRVPMRMIEPEPWSLGVRFQHEPAGMHRFTVVPGAPADGVPVGDVPVGSDAWISFVTRDGRLVPLRSDAVLRAGDDVVVLADLDEAAGLRAVFSEAAPVRKAD
ncbi:MAG: cation:proton antiporter [Actinobacteria bacterium]|nr:cation:proton antiporter [Actinomycetota bacterium]